MNITQEYLRTTLQSLLSFDGLTMESFHVDKLPTVLGSRFNVQVYLTNGDFLTIEGYNDKEKMGEEISDTIEGYLAANGLV